MELQEQVGLAWLFRCAGGCVQFISTGCDRSGDAWEPCSWNLFSGILWNRWATLQPRSSRTPACYCSSKHRLESAPWLPRRVRALRSASNKRSISHLRLSKSQYLVRRGKRSNICLNCLCWGVSLKYSSVMLISCAGRFNTASYSKKSGVVTSGHDLLFMQLRIRINYWDARFFKIFYVSCYHL